MPIAKGKAEYEVCVHETIDAHSQAGKDGPIWVTCYAWPPQRPTFTGVGSLILFSAPSQHLGEVFRGNLPCILYFYWIRNNYWKTNKAYAS